MKRTLFLTMAVGAMMLTACNKDDLGGAVLSNETISATLVDEAPQTRTALNGLQVVWNEDDAISVFAENGASVSNNMGAIKTGVGTTSATFDVVLEGTNKVAAAYPYMEATTYKDGKISMTLPNTYQYEENGIGGAPMAALIKTDDTSIAFKNAGALMGITVNNIPEGYNQAILTSKGDQAITGACKITFDLEGKPTITATADATGKTITINFEAAQTKTNKTFYFPIPVANYSTLELSIGNGTETKVLKTKELNAERSMRYKTTLTLDVVSGEIPANVTGAEAATEQLKDEGSNSVNVTITENEATPTITLPAKDKTKSTSLSFEAIPEGKTVTIEAAATGEEAQVSENVNITASSDVNSSNSFDINLPNSTVSLNANGETAVYKEVTALTAANTLIIANGVTVNTLRVKGGNVRVQGTVTAISREADNADEVTYVIYETGAEIPQSLGEKFKAVSAAEWELERELRETAKNGGQITLTEDLELFKPLKVVADMTLDLGGHTITGTNIANDAVILAYGATATIKGKGVVTTRSSYPLGAENGGTLVVEDGTFEATNSTQAVYIWNSGGSVYIKGGTFKVDSQYNGTSYVDDNENGKFVLNCYDSAYKDGSAKFVVTGGTFYKFDPANNVAEGDGTNFVEAGYSSVADGDWYTVSKGIKNGVALAAALAAGGEVALTDDIELTSAIIVENEVTLDLNNHKITTGKPLYVQGVVSAAICAKENGKLTIKGAGTVDAYSTDDYAVEVRGGELYIENGKFVGSSTAAYALTGTINISGGEFAIGEEVGKYGYDFVLNLKDENGKAGTASIHVTGGRYYKFDPSNNKSENPAKNYVAEGYSSTADGDWFVVNKIGE